MTAQLIQFPAQRPTFAAWLTERVGRWVVTKSRRPTWRGIDMSDRVQLLPRQYADYAAAYEAIYGDRYAA